MLVNQSIKTLIVLHYLSRLTWFHLNLVGNVDKGTFSTRNRIFYHHVNISLRLYHNCNTNIVESWAVHNFWFICLGQVNFNTHSLEVLSYVNWTTSVSPEWCYDLMPYVCYSKVSVHSLCIISVHVHSILCRLFDRWKRIFFQGYRISLIILLLILNKWRLERISYELIFIFLGKRIVL